MWVALFYIILYTYYKRLQRDFCNKKECVDLGNVDLKGKHGGLTLGMLARK